MEGLVGSVVVAVEPVAGEQVECDSCGKPACLLVSGASSLKFRHGHSAYRVFLCEPCYEREVSADDCSGF